MTKKVLSEVEGFKGLVYFYQPLNLEQVFSFEDAKDKAIEIEPSPFLTRLNEVTNNKDADGKVIEAQWSSRADQFFIPTLLKCIEKFEIENLDEKVTLEKFPLTPRHKSQMFIDFLWSELEKIYSGEIEVPNAS